MTKAASNTSRVLLVDDDGNWMLSLNDSVQHAFRNLERNVRCTVKRGFTEAVQALKKNKPWDLLITDLKLSSRREADANNLGKRLVELAHQDGVPVIVVSGLPGISVEEVADLFQKYGARAFFYKGTHFNNEDLTTQIAKALETTIDVAARRKRSVATQRHPDRSRIFVVHGRNKQAFDELQKFLKALELKVWSFEEAADACGGSAFVEDIVRYGMEHAQAVLVLFTPDERVKLDRRLDRSPEGLDARERMQSRPNVLFEAGMALGLDEKKTVLVTLGDDVALFSDIGGRHVIRLDNTKAAREKLRRRLHAMGCEVDLVATSYEREGDFAACVGGRTSPAPSSGRAAPRQRLVRAAPSPPRSTRRRASAPRAKD